MALIDKASLLMVPSTYEAGTLYNVLPSGNRAPDSTNQNSGYDQSRADFTFDRGSNAAATRVNASGLIEKYRENLLVQSNNFGTTWVNNGTTETSGQSGYDGSSDAWLLEKSIAGGSIRQAITYNGVGVFSIYAKASSLNHMLLYINYGSGTDSQAYFNLLNGSVGTTIAEIDAKIADAGNGWYRCSIAFNTPSATATILVFPSDADGSTSGTTGSIYIQDAQLESGLVATDYLESTSVTGKAGVLVDMPRINYDANGQNGALLLEPSRVNLVAFSEYFGASNWNKLAVNLTANNTESPEGNENAYLFVPTSSGGQIYDSIGKSASSIKYTASVFVKAKELTSLRMYVHGTSNANRGDATFNLSTESATYSNFGTFTETFADVEDYGNDWYRCVLTTKTDTSTGLQLVIRYDGATNSVDGLYLFGAQLEAGNYVSSYIPTMGTSETRAADSCSVTGVSDVIGQTEGVFLFEIGEKTTESIGIFEAGQGSSQHRFFVYTDTSKKLKVLVVDNYAVQVSYTSSVNVESNAKIAVAYKANDYAIYLNGSQLSTDTSASVPPMNQLAVGSDRGKIVTATNNTKQAVLFKERLSNTELATLTTL